jgi:hypothetical protein
MIEHPHALLKHFDRACSHIDAKTNFLCRGNVCPPHVICIDELQSTLATAVSADRFIIQRRVRVVADKRVTCGGSRCMPRSGCAGVALGPRRRRGCGAGSADTGLARLGTLRDTNASALTAAAHHVNVCREWLRGSMERRGA